MIFICTCIKSKNGHSHPAHVKLNTILANISFSLSIQGRNFERYFVGKTEFYSECV